MRCYFDCKWQQAILDVNEKWYWLGYSSPFNMPRRPTGEVEVQIYSFFNPGARCECVFNATPQVLYPLERDLVLVVQVAGWNPGPVWTGAENLGLTGTRYPALPARDDSLYRLTYPGPLLLRREKKKELSNRQTVISIYVKLLPWGFPSADWCCYLG